MTTKHSVSNETSQGSNGDMFQAITQGAVQTLTTTASSQAAAAFGAETNIVRLCASKACYVLIKDESTTVTASNGTLLTDGAIDYFTVTPTQVLTVIWLSEAGVLNITEGQ